MIYDPAGELALDDGGTRYRGTLINSNVGGPGTGHTLVCRLLCRYQHRDFLATGLSIYQEITVKREHG